MPTPGMRHVTGSTPPASTPPIPTPPNQKKGKQTTTQQSTSHVHVTRSAGGSVSKNVKKFTAPRKIKK